MSTRTRWALALVLVLGLAAASAALALSPLSLHHTRYGVSQFWAGHASTEGGYASVHLQNPTPVTMIAGVLVYERVQVDDDSSDPDATETVIHPDLDPAYDTSNRPGVFQHCFTVELEPHAAFNFDDSFVLSGHADDFRSYFEVIAVPAAPQTVGSSSTRLADGLGILVRQGGWSGGSYRAIYPGLFDEPSGAADECLCDAVSAYASVGFDATLWDDFGVNCE